MKRFCGMAGARLVGVLVVGWAWTAASPAQAIWPFGGGGVDYDLTFTGITDEEEDALRDVSLLEHPPKPPPADLTELEGLAAADARRMTLGMKAQGYYDVVVTLKFDRLAKPAHITFAIEKGTRYRYGAVQLSWLSRYHYPVENLAELAPKPGSPAEAAPMQEAGKKLKDQLQGQFCLFSLEVTPAVMLDHVRHIANPVMQVAAGPPARYGETAIAGRTRASEALVRHNLKYQPGDCYKPVQTAASKSALLGTQLFAQADIAPTTATPPPDGLVPMGAKLTERQPRTIRLGANYSTDEGAGVTAKWEHRNLNGDALKTTADFTLSERLQGIDLKAYQPDWRRDGQTLTSNAALQHEVTDAYNARTAQVGANIERPLRPYVTGGVGAGYRLTSVERESSGKRELFGLIFAPVFLQWDDRDSALNSTRGVQARGTITPYVDTLGSGANFLKSQITASTYLHHGDLPLDPVLALRGALGVITGASPDQVPADVRFYSGGGGSVRGYGYQSLGPRLNGDPLGGNSWLEFSSELRLKLTESFGLVAFLDGGAVGEDVFKNYGDGLSLGAGGGIRYFTPVGPLRFDVGVPLDKRPGIDGSYQLYVSLGQAF